MSNENNGTVSIVIPLFNEKWCVFPLFGKLRQAMDFQKEEWEFVFVDDGSTDGTYKALRELADQEPNVQIISLRRNFGLTQALQAGIDHATGDYVVTINGNLQNEPAEIRTLLEKLRQGYDVCVGWQSGGGEKLRKVRPGWLSNWCISKISGVKLHDYECTLRAYRADLLRGMRLYGDLDKYIPVYAFWRGGRIIEVKVKQYPRSHGQKGRSNRAKKSLKTILDLVLLKFMERYSDRPFYAFGTLGLVSFLCSLGSFSIMLFDKINNGVSFVETPLPLITALFFLTGIILLVLGIMAEFLTRIYHSGLGRGLYEIDQRRSLLADRS